MIENANTDTAGGIIIRGPGSGQPPMDVRLSNGLVQNLFAAREVRELQADAAAWPVTPDTYTAVTDLASRRNLTRTLLQEDGPEKDTLLTFRNEIRRLLQ